MPGFGSFEGLHMHMFACLFGGLFVCFLLLFPSFVPPSCRFRYAPLIWTCGFRRVKDGWFP